MTHHSSSTVLLMTPSVLTDNICCDQPASAAHVKRLNKSVQSNLGWGPCHGTVAHVCRKVAIGYNGAPQIHPKSTPFCLPIPKPHYLPHPWTRWTYDAKRHPDPICRFSTIHWTDRQTEWPTDHSQKSLTTIGCCALRATQPNNSMAIIIALHEQSTCQR